VTAPGERTALTWWRTAQTAIAAALVIAKPNFDHGGGRAVLGWIATSLALLIAGVAWLAARRRATAALLGIAVLVVALAATVLIEVIVAI
jgi:uncharacterized membrane protein YidH (DUF202 family)